MPGVIRRKYELLIAADTFESESENLNTGKNNPAIEDALPGQIHSRRGLQSDSSLSLKRFRAFKLSGQKKPTNADCFSRQPLFGHG